MKKSKFTEEQILFALKQGMPANRLRMCAGRWGSARRRITSGRSVTRTWGSWRFESSRQLRDENARLKNLVADLTLDRHVLQEVIKKKI